MNPNKISPKRTLRALVFKDDLLSNLSKTYEAAKNVIGK